jgi:hypothetical protein
LAAGFARRCAAAHFGRFPVHSAIRLRIIAACVIGAVAGAGRLAYLVEYPKRR